MKFTFNWISSFKLIPNRVHCRSITNLVWVSLSFIKAINEILKFTTIGLRLII